MKVKVRHLRLPIHLSSTVKPCLPDKDGPRHLLHLMRLMRYQHLQLRVTRPVCQRHDLLYTLASNGLHLLAMEALR